MVNRSFFDLLNRNFLILHRSFRYFTKEPGIRDDFNVFIRDNPMSRGRASITEMYKEMFKEQFDRSIHVLVKTSRIESL